MNLRETVNEYLRRCEGWREHPEHAGTYLQWEDLTVAEGDRATLPTDLAAVRQMAREGTE